jgi:hypothetical protein
VSAGERHPFAVVRPDGDVGPAIESLRRFGATILEDAVPAAICDSLRAAMLESLPDAAKGKPAENTPGHVQHNPPLRAAHLHPEVFANATAMEVIRAILGRGVTMTLYTGNTMLGGTTQMQPVHWDEGQLWPSLDAPAPAHSLTINLPLVDVTEENGAIEVWPGSHLDVRSGGRPSIHVPEEWLADRTSVRVPTTKGSILLRDGRMWHRGTSNSTPDPRPMVAIVYAAWWYRPLPIDFHTDCEPVLRDAHVRVFARYREDFDELAWPPSWDLVPAPSS